MAQNFLIIFFCTVCIFCLLGNTKLSVFPRVGIFVILVLIVALRPETMADYDNYKMGYMFGVERFELAYQLIHSTLHRLGQSFYIFVLVMAILTVGIKWSVILRMVHFPLLALLVWMSDILIIQDMIAIRAALASAFLLWIIYFKIDNNRLWMWVAFVCALFSHLTALSFVIIPFLSSEKSYRKLYLIALIVSLAIPLTNESAFAYLNTFSLKEYEYLVDAYSDQESANPYNLLVLARWLICVVLWWKCDTIKSVNKYFIISLKAYSIGCILFFCFWTQISVAFRFGELFWVTEIIIIPSLIYFFGTRHQTLGKLIPILIAIILFIINISIEEYWNAALL